MEGDAEGGSKQGEWIWNTQSRWAELQHGRTEEAMGLLGLGFPNGKSKRQRNLLVKVKEHILQWALPNVYAK